MYALIIIWDNGDPYVYGRYASEDDAKNALKKMQKKWDDFEWKHLAGTYIQKLRKKHEW